MGAEGSEIENHSRCRTRAGGSGAQGNQRQSGAGGEDARHHSSDVAKAHREVRHSALVEFEVSLTFGVPPLGGPAECARPGRSNHRASNRPESSKGSNAATLLRPRTGALRPPKGGTPNHPRLHFAFAL